MCGSEGKINAAQHTSALLTNSKIRENRLPTFAAAHSKITELQKFRLIFSGEYIYGRNP